MRKPRENSRRSPRLQGASQSLLSPDFGAGGSKENYKGISRKLVAVSAFSGVGIPGGSQLRARRTGRSCWRISGGLTDIREWFGACFPSVSGTSEIQAGCRKVQRKIRRGCEQI